MSGMHWTCVKRSEIEGLRARAEAAEERAERLAGTLRGLVNGVEALLHTATLSKIDPRRLVGVGGIRAEIERRIGAAHEALKGAAE